MSSYDAHIYLYIFIFKISKHIFIFSSQEEGNMVLKWHEYFEAMCDKYIDIYLNLYTKLLKGTSEILRLGAQNQISQYFY